MIKAELGHHIQAPVLAKFSNASVGHVDDFSNIIAPLYCVAMPCDALKGQLHRGDFNILHCACAHAHNASSAVLLKAAEGRVHVGASSGADWCHLDKGINYSVLLQTGNVLVHVFCTHDA
ncbi:hypothetical protein ACJBU6_04635 [Exserohilum turcicum]